MTVLMIVKVRSWTSEAYRQACVCVPSTVLNSFCGVPTGAAGHVVVDDDTGMKPRMTRRKFNPPCDKVTVEI